MSSAMIDCMFPVLSTLISAAPAPPPPHGRASPRSSSVVVITLRRVIVFPQPRNARGRGQVFYAGFGCRNSANFFTLSWRGGSDRRSPGGVTATRQNAEALSRHPAACAADLPLQALQGRVFMRDLAP